MRNFDILLKLTMNKCHIHPASLNVHRTVHSVLRTVHSVHRTVHSAHRTVHSIQYLYVYHTNPKIIFARYHSEFMCCALSSYS